MRRLLAAAGHQVFTPTLTGLGERSHLLSRDVGLDTHVADVANLMIWEDLRDVVLVGHSYGGAIITGAGANNPKVKALVYVAAFAPDAGETIGALIAQYPTTALGTGLVPDSAGFLFIDRAKFHEIFAKDVSVGESAIMAATQKPVAGASFGEAQAVAAWKTVPSWYVVSTQDHAINPDSERFMAKRMNARITEIEASHVSFISQPAKIVKIIEEAAATVMAGV